MKSKTKKKPQQAKIIIPIAKPNRPTSSISDLLAERDLAQLRVSRWENLEAAITRLMGSLRGKFGNKVDTSNGKATLYLAHDKAELSNRDGEVIADGAEEITEKLF